jgi:tRNA pseudouridine38-40 synthase
VAGAGRTDAGVHATGQVASFTTESGLATEAWMRALNAHLPSTIAALAVREMPSGFHARFSAASREYRYTILNRPVRSALERGRVWHVAASLDAAAMTLSLADLVGQHDFAAFAGASKSLRAGASTTRTVLSAACRREGDHLQVDLSANAFLPHMVRNVVGTLVLVGRGSLEPAAVRAILASRDRRRAGPTAPPDGLCLVRVNYGDPE